MAENTEFREIQEDLMEYFKDFDDKTFLDVCDILVFEIGTSDSNIGKLAEKFLKDNGLEEAYSNYIMELRRPSSMWLRHPSDIEMIEKIKKALLSLSFIRFRRTLILNNKEPKASPLYRLSGEEKRDLRMVIGECERMNDDLLENDDATRRMFNEDEANELIAERNRLAKLFTKVLKIIK